MAEDAQLDIRLVQATAAGDRDALGQLYDRHAALLIAVGSRIVGARAHAEDVLQDVFLEVWKRAHTYDSARASVRSWLLLRMRSRCLDRLKSAAESRRRPLEAAPEAHSGDDPVTHIDAARLHGWLAVLPDDQRSVIVLGYFRGMSCSEMADHLDIPIGTVKSRVAAGMRKLRTEFGSAGGAP